MSPGDFNNYPMADGADEVPATIYYDDIIEKMTVVKFLDYINEDSSKESQLLNSKLLLLKRGEKRGEHSGKLKIIRRGGLGSMV
jgi:hypothetical protein